jgi:hypothetical protein
MTLVITTGAVFAVGAVNRGADSTAAGDFSMVSGGRNNNILDNGDFATISGGENNVAVGPHSTVGGLLNNTTSGLNSTSMALGLSWKGYVDTNLKFSEFFVGNHTLALRFMAQFPHAYEGPFVAENGTGRFMIGQGDYLGGSAGTKLLLAVGSQSQTYVANLQPGRWYHLAVVATSGTQRSFTLYLDGSPLGAPLSIATSDPQLPNGTLRFGKRTTGQTVNGHDAQFYGFLDDIAVFTRELSPSEIQELNVNVLQITGNEKDLLAGYTFNQGDLPATLARPVIY